MNIVKVCDPIKVIEIFIFIGKNIQMKETLKNQYWMSSKNNKKFC